MEVLYTIVKVGMAASSSVQGWGDIVPTVPPVQVRTSSYRNRAESGHFRTKATRRSQALWHLRTRPITRSASLNQQSWNASRTDVRHTYKRSLQSFVFPSASDT